jgi:hypothetical protein
VLIAWPPGIRYPHIERKASQAARNILKYA